MNADLNQDCFNLMVARPSSNSQGRKRKSSSPGSSSSAHKRRSSGALFSRTEYAALQNQTKDTQSEVAGESSEEKVQVRDVMIKNKKNNNKQQQLRPPKAK
jgi:hypothetical protein